MFKRAIDDHGKYSHVALYELALLYYHKKEFLNARKLAKTYLKRHNHKELAVKAKQLLYSIDTGSYQQNIKGIEQPKITAAKYRYNALSLFNFPHFWLVHVGSEFFNFLGFKPGNPGQGLLSYSNQIVSALANFCLGLGAFRMDFASLWLAYVYHQKFLTNPGRINTYIDDVTDIKYFPFRFDLLQRKHRLSSGLTIKLHNDINAGVFVDLNLKNIGSNFFSDPDGFNSLKGTIEIEKSYLFLPWIGASYYKNFATILYAYLEKEENEDDNFSSMTFGLVGKVPVVATGAKQIFDIKPIDTRVVLDLFLVPYVFNDFWLDFTRVGGAIKVKTELFSKLNMAARFGYFFDRFERQIIRSHKCDSFPYELKETLVRSEGLKAVYCYRDQSVFLGEFTTSYSISSTKLIEATVSASNVTSNLQEYERTELKITLGLTFSFPSAEKSLSYVNKFYDPVYLIGKEDYGYIR